MAVAVDSLAYRACTTHRSHRTKALARTAILWHRAGYRAGRFPCVKCDRGQLLHAWRCSALGTPHWHAGHSQRGI